MFHSYQNNNQDEHFFQSQFETLKSQELVWQGNQHSKLTLMGFPLNEWVCTHRQRYG